MRRESSVPDLAGAIPTALTRGVVEVAARTLGHPLTSSLVSRRPWPIGGDPWAAGSGAFHTSRFEFGGPRGSVLVVEYPDVFDRFVVAGPGGARWIHTGGSAPRDARRELAEASRSLVANVLTPPDDRSGPEPLSNADVEDLTRRVYGLPEDLRDAYADALPSGLARDLGGLPILSRYPAPLSVVGGHGGDLGRAVLAALRGVDAGVPLEWSLRRLSAAVS